MIILTNILFFTNENAFALFRSISIFRREILEEIQSSNQAAAVSGMPKATGLLKSTLAAGSAKKLIEQFKAKKAANQDSKK